MTMDELAIISEIDFRQIGRIERAEVNTSFISLFRISKALKVDIRELFSDEMNKVIN
jgi:transcriptional regulator with XRE-family HTH domain